MHATGKTGEAQLISNAALRGRGRERERAKRYARPTRSIIIRKNQLQTRKQRLPACLAHQAALPLPENHPHSAPEVFPMAGKKAKLNRGNYAHELRWTIKSRIAKENEQKKRTRQINYEQQEGGGGSGGRGIIYLRV